LVEILAGGFAAKCAVGPVIIGEASEGVDALVDAIEPVREVMAGVELVSP
jgi:hypothetical protein